MPDLTTALLCSGLPGKTGEGALGSDGWVHSINCNNILLGALSKPSKLGRHGMCVSVCLSHLRNMTLIKEAPCLRVAQFCFYPIVVPYFYSFILAHPNSRPF